MSALMEVVSNRADRLSAFRRDLHQHPELGFQEHYTSALVANELGRLGIEHTRGVAETGVVGLIEGQPGGKTVMLRFDMDALPIEEENEVSYRSQTPGLMHACGHDGHVAVGLVVADVLNDRRKDFRGTVKLVFQPAEEALGGAERMVSAGVLTDPRPDIALGMHVWNGKPYGWLGITDGPAIAGSGLFTIRLTGQGGHGAVPDITKDPVLAAAHLTTLLQSIVSRNLSPLESGVVSVTRIRAGEAFNVIPSTAELAGTFRWFREEERQRIEERIETLSQGVAVGMEMMVETKLEGLTPALVNDARLAQAVRDAAREVCPDFVIDSTYQTMGAEDMAFFLNQVPGCFFMVGSANAEQGLTYGHHHPRFDFDERALTTGAVLMSQAALNLLG